jgi:hypothetical protein
MTIFECIKSFHGDRVSSKNNGAKPLFEQLIDNSFAAEAYDLMQHINPFNKFPGSVPGNLF